MFSKILVHLFLAVLIIDQGLCEETCTYSEETGKGYTCTLKDVNVQDDLVIATGGHPTDIGKGDTDVETLQAKTSNIKNFPRAIFTKFANLTTIELVDVQMTTFGSKIDSCSKLTTVILSKNNLTTLPDGFFSNCQEVTTLSFSENIVKDVHENTLSGLTKLVKVHLNNNKISELNANIFKNNRELTEILLSSNELKKINEAVFKGLAKLETLDLNNNQIDEVPSFDGCTSLKEIHLHLNKITELKSAVFKSQTKMTKLVLSNNTITEIKKASFESCDVLDTLDLKANKIKSIEKEFFDAVPKLKTLVLDQNECVSKTFNSIKIEDIKNESDLSDCYNAATSMKVSLALVFMYIFINLLK